MDRSFALFVVTTAVFFLVGILFSSGSPADVVQPLPFNHAVHTAKMECWECHFVCANNRDEDGELDCEDCDDVETGPFCDQHLACPDHKLPGLPGIRECLRCHEYDLLELKETDPSAEEEAPDRAKRALFDYVAFDEYDELQILGEIPWERVTSLPTSAVFFSHRTHALVQELSCVVCHGDVGQMTEPPGRPAVALTMKGCIACHEERQATEDCASCHQ